MSERANVYVTTTLSAGQCERVRDNDVISRFATDSMMMMILYDVCVRVFYAYAIVPI